MNASLSRRAEEIFGAALDLAPGARADFIAQACEGEPELRAEVQAMLGAWERSANYFERLPERLGMANLLAEVPAPTTVCDRAPPVGEPGGKYGHYTLTECIGTGGMGTVWRARRHDGRFESEVAIKLLSPLAQPQALERFAHEGRFLARLTHPNIARLLDAGVAPSGLLPYLVIEYVRGLPIDQYCDEHALGIEARVGLFLQVLEAVAHAHAHLIVHRDLKPSNIHVTAAGDVKLLDFGIAKLLAADETGGEDLTRQLGAALTPQFAAPEQLEGATVTTATDVYSLGLVLWLLVAGATPRTRATVNSLAEMRALAHRDPVRLLDPVRSDTSFDELARLAARRASSPAELLAKLRGDLDSIVRKAVAVEPRERYTSANDFAQDLRRLLRHEPVSAQANTVPYRLRKFLRRHRGGVAAASLALLAVLTAGGMAIWQGIEARAQRDAAVYQQRRAQAYSEFMNLLLSDAGAAGKPLMLGDLLDRGVAMLDQQYGAQEGFLGFLLYEIASGYFPLGRHDRVVELTRRATEAARQRGDRDLLAAALCTQARIEMRTRPEESRQALTEARGILTSLAAPSTESRVSCARGEAILLELDGDRAGGIEKLQATLVDIEAEPAASLRHRLYLMNELSRLHFHSQDVAATQALNDRILATMDGSGLGDSMGYVIVSSNRSALLRLSGEVVRSVEAQRQLLERLGDAGPDLRPVGLGNTYAIGLIRLERFDEAQRVLEAEANAARQQGNLHVVAESELQLGRVFAATGRFDEAERMLASAEAQLNKAASNNQRLLDAIPVVRAQILAAQGRSAEARALILSALSRMGYPERKDSPPLLHPLREAAQIVLGAGDAEAAARLAEDFHALALRHARDPQASADVGAALLIRGQARRLLGQKAEARADLIAAVPALSAGLGAEHTETRRARELLNDT